MELKNILDLIDPGKPPEPLEAKANLPQDLFYNFAKNILLPGIGVLAVLVIIYGGILYATAGANEEQTGRAKKMLLYGIIGLIVIIASWAIYGKIISI